MQPTETRSARLSFIDYLRAIAVLWMIEVHVIDVCLSPLLKTGRLFEILDISNGFVAVAFIFCAGIGFELAFSKKNEAFRGFERPLWLYIRRLGHILLLAYWLHLPAFSLQRLLNGSALELQHFYDCDVLQTITFSSCIALLFSMLSASSRWRLSASLVLTAACFGFASIVLPWHLYASFPNGWSSLLSGVPYSKFPLIPYSGYFFAGMAFIQLFGNTDNLDKRAALVALCSTLAAILCYTLKEGVFDFPGREDWWHLSAGHSLYRLSVVVAVLMLLYLLRKQLDPTALARVMLVCGQESLFIYIFHLFAVYGYIGSLSLSGWSHQSWGWFQNLVVYLVVCSMSIVLALRWHSFKKNKPLLAERGLRWVIIIAIVSFVLVPASLTQ